MYQKYNVWGEEGGKRDKKIKKAKEERRKKGEEWRTVGGYVGEYAKLTGKFI